VLAAALGLVDRPLDSIDAMNAGPLLSEARSAELARRLADADANPDDFVDWEDFKKQPLARLRK
jgi:putative addiction module component (TIGR02574 family)